MAEPVPEEERTKMWMGSKGPYKCPAGKNFKQTFPDGAEPKPPGSPGSKNLYLQRAEARRRSSTRADPPDYNYPGAVDLVPEYWIQEMIAGGAEKGAANVSTVAPVEVAKGETTPTLPGEWPMPTYEFSVTGLSATITEIYSVNWPYEVWLVDKTFLNGVLQSESAPYKETSP